MSEYFTTLLQPTLNIAEQAGKQLTHFYQKFSQSAVDFQKKSDDTPVTEVDLFLSQFLTDQLSTLTPHIPILSEENCDIPLQERQKWSYYWLVDPLDGTQQFINRTDQFSILITLMKHNRPVLGIIHSPILGKTYYAMQGFGAYKQEKQKISKITPRFYDGNRKLKIAIGETTKPEKVRSIFKKDFPHEFIIYGSSGLKGAMVAEGVADCYVRLGNTGEWDTTASEIILKEMGGNIFAPQFKPLQYNQRESLTNPHFIMVGDGKFNWQEVFKFD